MTYCVAIWLKKGIVFCSDSRTNAGVDQISTYSKMHRFGREGDRQFCILTAGNLATTQAVIAQLKKDIDESGKRSLMTVTTVDEAADYLGEVTVSKQQRYAQSFEGGYEASFLLGGQIHGDTHKVMLVYPQGNHINTSQDTLFLQIGESKYGKPMLDRIITPDTPMETAAVCALVSMDSTMRSNLIVGPPIELLVYEADHFVFDHYCRFEHDNKYLHELKLAWHAKLKEAFRTLPPLDWAATEGKYQECN
ncbi:MAG TPA: peptidase [Gammaproteobacteria bacterium]